MNTVDQQQQQLDGAYDVPWEFKTKNALTSLGQLKGNNRNIYVDKEENRPPPPPPCTCRTKSSNTSNSSGGGGKCSTANNKCSTSTSIGKCSVGTPPCGVKAREMINRSKQNAGGEVQQQDLDYIVWKYRGPESDVRPSSEYDPPWDLQQQGRAERPPPQIRRRSTAESAKSAGEVGTKIGVDCVAKATGVEAEKVSEDSGVYDEPWDSSKSATRRCSMSKMILFKSNEDASSSSCNPSPSTSRSTSSQSGQSFELGRETFTRNNNRNSGRCSKKNSSNEAAMTVMETAFCAKAAPTSTRNGCGQQRDRLIQELCNKTPPEPPKAAPIPAMRRSKLKSTSPGEIKSVDDAFDVNGPSTSALGQEDVYDIPWEFRPNVATVKQLKLNIQKKCGDENEKQSDVNIVGDGTAPSKNNFNRQNLRLNFGCAALNPTSEKVDAALPLDQQSWYHGNVTRAEAEQRLRPCKEGSYLVRVCESAASVGQPGHKLHEEYALSLKSAKGFMHMKIQLNADKKWILGYFSHPFESISKMIRYYSVNKLPIKGAEHMCLLQPIADQVL